MRPEDRRRFPRKSQRFLVKFKSIGGAHQKDVGERVGMVINISKGGIVLTSKREFQVDTLFEIKIPATPLGPAREIKGKVVWSKTAAESGEDHLGCMFIRIVDPNPEDRRQYERKPVKLPLSLRGIEDDESLEGQLSDLSAGGIEFAGPHAFAKGSIVVVGFPASPLGGARVVYVQVLRCEPGEKPGWHAMAGKFVTV